MAMIINLNCVIKNYPEFKEFLFLAFMPLNKNAYLRYRVIDQCLTNSMKPFPNKEFIREKLEEVVGRVSVSSIEKDFGKMKELFNAPIEFNRLKKGYYYTEPGFSIKEFPLTQDEITALDFSTGILQALKSHLFLIKSKEQLIK